MARVPVLVDQRELEAYSYLKPPAYILRNPNEDEVAAIERVRQDLVVDPASMETDSLAWQIYEDQLYDSNRKVLAQVLGISLDEKTTQQQYVGAAARQGSR